MLFLSAIATLSLIADCHPCPAPLRVMLDQQQTVISAVQDAVQHLMTRSVPAESLQLAEMRAQLVAGWQWGQSVVARSSHHLTGHLPAAVTETAAADGFAVLALGSGSIPVAPAAPAAMKESGASPAATVFASAGPATAHPYAPAWSEADMSVTNNAEHVSRMQRHNSPAQVPA